MFKVFENPRSGYWEVREVRADRSRLRARRLTRRGAEVALATLESQVATREQPAATILAGG